MVQNESLINVVSAIGALGLTNTGGSIRKKHLSEALGYYNTAVTALRSEIEGATPRRQDLLSLSWSTFLLGLFELMYDETGAGWVWHLLRGTGQILQLLTPDGCRVGAGRELFLEVRVFEIARAMLFSDTTFLSTRPWVDMMERMWESEYSTEWNPKENLLDLMILISDLCVRTSKFMLSKATNDLSADDIQTMRAYAMEGFQLTSSLAAWKTVADRWYPTTSTDHQATLSRIFYAAISIYHSGTYDYSPLWHQYNICTPSLPKYEIQEHVNIILDTSSQALDHTNLTRLIFLFPLRIAGARASNIRQRNRIQALLEQIVPSFKVASAFLVDLGQLWENPDDV